jgi:cell division protein DivIC
MLPGFFYFWEIDYISSMISRFFKNLPPYTRNFYFLFTFFFLIWMLFLDSNDVFTQLRLSRKLSDLEADKEYYLEKIEEVRKDRHELLSDSDLLEKFARERYMMKKPTEDLYIIVAEE